MQKQQQRQHPLQMLIYCDDTKWRLSNVTSHHIRANPIVISFCNTHSHTLHHQWMIFIDPTWRNEFQFHRHSSDEDGIHHTLPSQAKFENWVQHRKSFRKKKTKLPTIDIFWIFNEISKCMPSNRFGIYNFELVVCWTGSISLSE